MRNGDAFWVAFHLPFLLYTSAFGPKYTAEVDIIDDTGSVSA